MPRRNQSRQAFTVIELLVVVLILGILVSVALPAYLASIKEAKVKTANSNARAIAAAYQSAYVRGGGSSYSTIDTGVVATEMNGIPQNPCSSVGGAAGYDITRTTGGMTITPTNDQGCATPATSVLGTL